MYNVDRVVRTTPLPTYLFFSSINSHAEWRIDDARTLSNVFVNHDVHVFKIRNIFLNWGGRNMRIYFCLPTLKYRGSPDSTNFGSQDNRVIREIMLIGDWISTKTSEIDTFDFQSPLFYINKIFSHENPCYSVQKSC